MKKILFTFLAIVSVVLTTLAEVQRPSIAVFDPTTSGELDEGTKIAIREMISYTVVNTGQYNLVERSLLEKVMQEQQFNNSGLVSETDATEIGKLAGANKIILSVLAPTGGRFMLSIKSIDVKTASVERQQLKMVTPEELLEAVGPLTLDVISSETKVVVDNSNSEHPIPAKDEYILYFPKGFTPKVAPKNDRNPLLVVEVDRKQVGVSKMFDGFCIRVKNDKPGEHLVKVKNRSDGMTINTKEYNFFEFFINEWEFMGAPMYTFHLKESHKY